MHGYLYAAESSIHPGLIKLGRSQDVQKRLRSLSGAGALGDWTLLKAYLVKNVVHAEGLLHERAERFRSARAGAAHRRELYEMTPSEAAALCEEIATFMGPPEPAKAETVDEFAVESEHPAVMAWLRLGVSFQQRRHSIAALVVAAQQSPTGQAAKRLARMGAPMVNVAQERGLFRFDGEFKDGCGTALDLPSLAWLNVKRVVRPHVA